MEYSILPCLMTGMLENMEPSSYALVKGDEILAVALGTREKYPKVWTAREMSAFRGATSTNYFGKTFFACILKTEIFREKDSVILKKFLRSDG